ncbi:hypothetical protein BY458DRAFT_498362 [Sporodiniella umbellata]|nr:hypothetical protein BY458DRAFT_498362 [Sporodiniella umbellata]
MMVFRGFSILKNAKNTKRTYFSSYTKAKEETVDKKTPKKSPSEVIPYMPVINIPVSELAFNAFYSLHRPLLGLSAPKPFKAGNLVGEIKKEESNKEEVFANYMATLRPFQPPETPGETFTPTPAPTTTTLTVEIDPSYFLQHNNNHIEIADYLSAIQKEIDSFYSKDSKRTLVKKKRMRKRSHPLGFFEKN